MGAFRGRGVSLDFAAISQEMGPVAELWMNGIVQIIDPNLEDVGDDWDVELNLPTGSAEPTVLLQTKARIQPRIPLSATRTNDVGFSENSVRAIKVAIPLGVEPEFLRKGLQVLVVDGGEDQALNGMIFIIKSAINSGQAWVRTIDCEADMKNEANAEWSGIAGTVTSFEDGEPIEGATIQSLTLLDDIWELEYETTTDVLGNYELPATPDLPVIVRCRKSGYGMQYYELAVTAMDATLVVPENHEEEQGIDFVMASG